MSGKAHSQITVTLPATASVRTDVNSSVTVGGVNVGSCGIGPTDNVAICTIGSTSTIAANNSGSGPGGQLVLRGDNQVTLSNGASGVFIRGGSANDFVVGNDIGGNSSGYGGLSYYLKNLRRFLGR